MDDKTFYSQTKALLKGINMKVMENLVKMYAPYDLTPPQAGLITILKHRGLVRVSELGELMKTPDSNVSSICRRLEDRGFVERIRDENDRRVVYIKATEKTQNLYENLECESENFFNKIRNLTDEEKINIISSLEQLNSLIVQDKK